MLQEFAVGHALTDLLQENTANDQTDQVGHQINIRFRDEKLGWSRTSLLALAVMRPFAACHTGSPLRAKECYRSHVLRTGCNGGMSISRLSSSSMRPSGLDVAARGRQLGRDGLSTSVIDCWRRWSDSELIGSPANSPTFVALILPLRPVFGIEDFVVSSPDVLLSLVACWPPCLVRRVGFLGTGGAGLRATLVEPEIFAG